MHGFLDVNGAFTTIDVPGSHFTLLYGINNSGQIVGVDSLVTTTPEPGTFALLALGLTVVSVSRLRKRARTTQ